MITSPKVHEGCEQRKKKKSFFGYNIMLPKSFLNENCKNMRKQDETKILRLYFLMHILRRFHTIIHT